MRGAAMVAIAAALLLGPAGAGGASNQTLTAESRVLVAYSQEGGIKFRHTSLIVSAQGKARVRFEGRKVRFHLNDSLWKRLRAALKRTDVHALAGDHFPPTPYPDAITYVITVGPDTVRTTDGAIPRKLESLVSVLREIARAGERKIQRADQNRP